MREQLHALTGLVDAAGVGEFADGDWAGGIDAALVDPGLDAVEVYEGEVEREPLRTNTQRSAWESGRQDRIGWMEGDGRTHS